MKRTTVRVGDLMAKTARTSDRCVPPAANLLLLTHRHRSHIFRFLPGVAGNPFYADRVTISIGKLPFETANLAFQTVMSDLEIV